MTEQNTQPVNPLSMTDEEALALDLSPVEAEGVVTPPEGTEPPQNEPEGVVAGDEGGSPEVQPAETAEGGTPTEQVTDPFEGQPAAKQEDGAPASNKDAIDYKAFYERVTAPFKADGHELTVDNPDDMIKLMQKGVNYQRKTQELAEDRRYIQVLKDNGLYDQDKLSLVVDVVKGDKQAIAKLLKEHSIDMYDLSDSEGDDYQSKNYLPSAENIALADVVSTLQTDPKFESFWSDVLKMDAASRQFITANPNTLSDLFDNFKAGIHQEIVGKYNQLNLLGKIPHGTTFLQAYSAIGQQLMAERANKPATKVVAPKPAAKPQPIDSPLLGTPHKGSGAKPTPNVLNMSDEEFLKQFS